jgi:hypothetical protein
LAEVCQPAFLRQLCLRLSAAAAMGDDVDDEEEEKELSKKANKSN